MTFNANGSEIPKLFVEVFQKTFDLKFEDYLAKEGRGFISVVVSNQNPDGLLSAQHGLEERSALALFADAMKFTRFDGFGAYFTPTRFLKAPLKHDVLLIQQRWLDLGNKGRTAIAYHEACHCFRDSKFFESIAKAFREHRGGEHYRRFTQYHDNENFGHNREWFALLVAKANVVQSQYAGLFASSHDVIESALSGDLLLCEGEVLPQWNSKEAAA